MALLIDKTKEPNTDLTASSAKQLRQLFHVDYFSERPFERRQMDFTNLLPRYKTKPATADVSGETDIFHHHGFETQILSVSGSLCVSVCVSVCACVSVCLCVSLC